MTGYGIINNQNPNQNPNQNSNQNSNQNPNQNPITLNNMFKNDSFTICPKLLNLDILDQPFSDLASIFIKDIREECYNSIILPILRENRKNKKINKNINKNKKIIQSSPVYVKVNRPLESGSGRNITLRHILTTMINSDYYGDEIVQNHPNHNLIGFSQVSESVYVANFV